MSNIRAEEWYRSSKGNPAHDGDCLVLYMFRYPPSKHPGLLAYRNSDEGRAECAEVIGKLGSWKSQKTVSVLKETDKAWIEPLVCTARNYTNQNARTRSRTGMQQRAGRYRYLARPTYRPSQCPGAITVRARDTLGPQRRSSQRAVRANAKMSSHFSTPYIFVRSESATL